MHRAVTHHTSPARTRPVRLWVAVSALLAVLLALVLAGCSSGSSATTSAPWKAGGAAASDSRSAGISNLPGNAGISGTKGVPGANQVPEVDSAPGAKPPTGAASSGGVSRPSVSPAVGLGPKLTRNASLELQVKDVAAAAARVRSIAAGVQAQVVNELIGGGTGDPTLQNPEVPSTATSDGNSSDTRSSGPRPPSVIGGSRDFGTLTLSVPSEKLDAALDQLARVGTVLQRSASSADVTAQYVDTQSRLKTMQASVERVRALMAQAKDLGQVVALESELSRRQADLESLESQLAALKTSVERSTLTVSLSIPGAETVESNGFVTGLSAGWDAFLSSAGGLLKGIGAALPFAVFFALLAAPLVAWLRRRRTVPTAA